MSYLNITIELFTLSTILTIFSVDNLRKEHIIVNIYKQAYINLINRIKTIIAYKTYFRIFLDNMNFIFSQPNIQLYQICKYLRCRHQLAEPLLSK